MAFLLDILVGVYHWYFPILLSFTCSLLNLSSASFWSNFLSCLFLSSVLHNVLLECLSYSLLPPFPWMCPSMSVLVTLFFPFQSNPAFCLSDTFWLSLLYPSSFRFIPWFLFPSRNKSTQSVSVTADHRNVVTVCTVSSTLRRHVRSEHNATVTADYRAQSAVVLVRSGQTNFPPPDQIGENKSIWNQRFWRYWTE